MDKIPVLPGGSMLGHVDELRSNPLHVFTRTYRECGDIGRFRLLKRWIVLVQRPDAIHKVLLTRSKELNKSYGARVLFRPLLGEGLISSEGAFWRRQRKLLAPIFAKAEVKALGDRMLTADDAPSLDLTRRIIMEAQRLHPTVYMLD